MKSHRPLVSLAPSIPLLIMIAGGSTACSPADREVQALPPESNGESIPENFTGDVQTDFNHPTGIMIPDPGGLDVGVPQAGGNAISGNDLEEVALEYSVADDTLLVGLATYGIAGDVDGDGNASQTSSWLAGLGGRDVAHFGGTESFTFSLDLNEDGVFDVIAGVPLGSDLNGFVVSRFSGSPYSPSLAFGSSLPSHTGVVYGSPDALSPHIELTILRFSQLASSLGLTDARPSFAVNAFMGSFEDAGIGEDHIPGIGTTAPVCFDMDQDGISTCADDCDDNNANAYPEHAEVCDGVDNDCNGQSDEGYDEDGDGHAACAIGSDPADCDDQDDQVYPGGTERCDAQDNDCDGQSDEGFDQDGDGYPTCSINGSTPDCKDSDPDIHPGASEQCNGKDDNCDGSIDEGYDVDSDGYTTCEGDCDDHDAATHPGALERCDGIDNNCDRQTDEGYDGDRDGVTTCQGDCDDRRSDTYPGATEKCDARDNDCDGKVDEGFDSDGDGYTICGGGGKGADCMDLDADIHPDAPEVCDGHDNDCDNQLDEGFDQDQDGFTSCNGDCDDSKWEVNPACPESCNGIDDNCDGQTDEGYDLDSDGVKACEGDCDDLDAALHPGATEVCDGVDNNCNGQSDEGFDQDADGVSSCQGDCDDHNASVHPGASERCDGLDNDCDGQLDDGLDADGDGHLSCGPTPDCNDGDAAIHPGATELCDHRDNNCNGQSDEGFDADGDGVLTCDGDCDDQNPVVYPGALESCSDGLDNDCDGDIDGDDPICQTGCVSYDLGAARGFNLFVFQDYLEGLDVTGRVAAGGLIQLSMFSVSEHAPGGDVLIAGERLELSHGTVYGNAHYGLSATVAETVNFQAGGSLQQGLPIDFGAAQTDLIESSDALETLPDNALAVIYDWKAVRLVGSDDTLNVVSLSAAELSVAVSLSIAAPASSVMVINVRGEEALMHDFGIFLEGIDRSRVIFNFPDAMHFDLYGIGVLGSVLAPHADVSFDNGNFDGTFIANSFVGDAEGHHYPFGGEIEVCR